MFNKIIAAILPFLPPKFIWLFSKRYIAGKTVNEAIAACRNLNEQGMLFTLDILGEFIKTLDEAEENKKQYLALIDRVEKEHLKGNYSIKPSMFGLLLNKEQCYNHIREIIKKAASYNNSVRIDMEDSPCTTDTIEIYRKIKSDYSKNVGIVLQTYMKRTLQDLTDLIDVHSEENEVNIRLCKGIYVESASIAYKHYHEINMHFIADLEFMLKNKFYAAIATHDKLLIQEAIKLIEKYKVPKNKYEFQMLYGVMPELRKSIVDAGHKMRVYVPFGEHWFGYSTRRLKENPKMTWLIIKALFVRG